MNTAWGNIKNDDGSFKDDGSINPESMTIITNIQKILDPTSVVRESEYARVGAGQSVWNRIEGTFDRLKQGGAGVSKIELEGFVSMANQFLEGYKDVTVLNGIEMVIYEIELLLHQESDI